MANYAVRKIHKNMFPGTYNFKADTDAAEPTGWTTNNDASCTTTVIAILGTHRKVLQLYDNNNAGVYDIEIDFSALQTVGKIDLWFRTTDNTLDNYLQLLDTANTVCVEVDLNAIAGVGDDTYYHYSIDFDCTPDTYDHYLDGVSIASGVAFDAGDDGSGLLTIKFTSIAADDAYYNYIDAIGFSWDTDYVWGDNIHWRGYEDQDSDFESEDLYTSGVSMDFADASFCAGVGTARIIPSYNEHKKILELYHGPLAADDTGIDNDFAAQTNGTIEYWVKTSDATVTSYTLLFSGGVQKVTFRITGDLFQWYDGAWQTFSTIPLDNTWYYIRIDFECAAGAYKGLAADTATIYINNISQGTWGFSGVADNLDNFKLWCDSTATYYTYIDAVSYSWTTGNDLADNRMLEYHTLSYEDITTDIINVTYSNILYQWRKCTLFTTEKWEKDLYIFKVFDINSVLAFEGETKGRTQEGVLYAYFLRDKNWDELNNRSSNTFSAAKIHDPTVSGSMLKTILPTVGQADGDLILVEGDTKTDTYSPTSKYYPDHMALRDIADIADSCIIIKASGKVYLDDDLASGTVLDVDTAAHKDSMTDDPKIVDILETINYYEIFGGMNPDTGTRFSKVIDNSGTDKKRKWRYTNNNFITQTDVDNYAAKLEARVIHIRNITIFAQGLGTHDMGTTLDYKFVHAPINIPQANYYIIEERINFDINQHTIVLSEGVLEKSKYSAVFEKPQEYTDSFAGEIYETDINTIQGSFFGNNGAGFGNIGIQINAVGERCDAFFYLDDKVDDSRNIVATFSWFRNDVGADTISALYSLATMPADGSATWTWVNGNAALGDAITLDACAQNRCEKWAITIDNSDITAGDIIMIRLHMNEVNKDIDILNVILRYYVKRSV